MQMTSLYAPITKSYEQDDGTVIVEGIISDGSLDLDQQRADPDWLSEAVPTWMSFGNLREQHDKYRAIGKAFEHKDLGDQGHFIRGRIYDSEAVKKVKGGVFNGFSIGVKDYHLSKSADAPNGLLDGGRICEVSLVDFPCNENCRLVMAKSLTPGMSKIPIEDVDAQHMLVRVEEYFEKTVSPDLRKDRPTMTVSVSESIPPEKLAELNAKVAAEPEVKKDANSYGAPDVDSDADAPMPTGCGCCAECVCPSSASDSAKDSTAPDFDRDAAKALVAKAAAKADSGLGQDESGDISGALQAISIIAQLIESEAKDLGDTPAQGCDIDLLMQAVHALRAFNCREAKEQAGIDPGPPPLMLGADSDLEKSKYSAEQLRQMLKDGKAFKNPNGEPSYPIGDKEDLENAIDAVGRGSGDHDAIRAYIIRRAKALGCSNMIPDNWTSSGSKGSSKSVEPEKEKTVEVETTVVEDAVVADSEVEKSTEPEVEKALVVDIDAPAASDSDALVKALSAALEKADNPLIKSFEAIFEKSTGAIQKSVSDLAERLATVEEMATAGGPQLRRTEIETKTAQKSDLLRQAKYWGDKSEFVTDLDLKKYYATTAKDFLAKATALGV